MPWALPETDDALLRPAKGYPYAAPAGSYLYRDGASKPLEGSLDPDLMAGRVPVIAHGSNRAPEQLHRKFGHLAGAASARSEEHTSELQSLMRISYAVFCLKKKKHKKK